MGPEYLSLALAAIVAGVTGGSWTASRILDRHKEKIDLLNKSSDAEKRRIDSLEDQLTRMPFDYVLKVDFLREIQEMHENFRQINGKLDKLMEKLFSK